MVGNSEIALLYSMESTAAIDSSRFIHKSIQQLQEERYG